MPEFLTRIFGRDVQQTILQYFNEMKVKGSKLAEEMRFSGVLKNPSQVVFGFAKSEVNMALKVKYEVADDNQVYITEATMTPDTPWFKKYFFSCQEGKRYNFPSFSSISEDISKWCQAKINTKAEHPEKKVWCQSAAQTLDDYYMYGEPYPKTLQECAVVRSMQVYSFHFEPDSDGVDVEADVKFDLRYSFPVIGYKHLDNDGKKKAGHGINKYFVGGLILGGAYEDFKRLLSKTKASMDCTPALEGLLQVMMEPKLATR